MRASGIVRPHTGQLTSVAAAIASLLKYFSITRVTAAGRCTAVQAVCGGAAVLRCSGAAMHGMASGNGAAGRNRNRRKLSRRIFIDF